ncbi:MAG TPA: ATP-binding protein [Capsulimonadaceae bacterium]|jgi:serine/threonine-protein kinase RsbW
MILRLMLDLPEDRAYVRLTRLLGRTLLEHLKVIDQDIDDLELVVGELCANVVRHAQSNSGRFQIVLEYHAERVVIVVEDQGKGFSFRDVPPAGTSRDDFDGQSRIGGFGLQVVKKLSDQLEFYRSDQNGSCVKAQMLLRYKTLEAEGEAQAMNQSLGEANVQLSRTALTSDA